MYRAGESVTSRDVTDWCCLIFLYLLDLPTLSVHKSKQIQCRLMTSGSSPTQYGPHQLIIANYNEKVSNQIKLWSWIEPEDLAKIRLLPVDVSSYSEQSLGGAEVVHFGPCPFHSWKCGIQGTIDWLCQSVNLVRVPSGDRIVLVTRNSPSN